MANKSWSEYAEDLKNAIANSVSNGDFRTQSVTKIDGTSVTYVSYDELFDAYKIARSFAAEEESRIKSPHKFIHFRRSRFGA